MVSEVINQGWLKVDEVIEAFELAWTSAAIPEIAHYLPPLKHRHYHETLLELVRVDLELRWQHGCAKPLDEYRLEFPQLFANSESLSLVAFEEYRARRHSGESVTTNEYERRYGILTDRWPVVPVANDTPQPSTIISKNDSGRDQRTIGSTTSVVAAFPEVGTEFLSFSLQSELGRGAFSRVYLARQSDLANRLVVLKVSAESFAEADNLAQLQHANIVPIYSIHRVGNLSAVCMPYFGAATLADIVREIRGLRSMPSSGRTIVETLAGCSQRTEELHRRAILRLNGSENHEQLKEQHSNCDKCPRYEGRLKTLSGMSYVDAVLWIGAKLADGLNHAHERGILHLDLKPANVLLADDGQPMLLDFNLSEDLKQIASVRESLVGGTLPYMAPEQIYAFQHRIRSGDARSDIYSVGVILFELLSGRNPFPAYEKCSLEKLLVNTIHDRHHIPPRLHKWNPDATPAVEAIIQRCLNANPAHRYQTAAQLHEDLERHLKQLPLRHTREPSVGERFHKWTRRHSWLASIISIVLIVMGISLAIAVYQERQRIATVATEVGSLMKAGRQALDDNDADVAHGRFLAAWMKVQAEPSLVKHHSSVAGWLDHSRRAVIQRQWKQRMPPREYDARRDEALLLSLLLKPPVDRQVKIAREAIRAAMNFTIPGDPGWTKEREQLTLLEADLIALEFDAEHALRHLDSTNEFSSRRFHERRATLFNQLQRSSEAEQARRQAERFPPDKVVDNFSNGVVRARHQDFELALQDFEHVLEYQPDLFIARLFQAICLLQLDRPGEARVALTACIAQRPHFAWSCFFRSQASVALGDIKAALTDLQLVLDLKPSDSLGRAALAQIELLGSK